MKKVLIPIVYFFVCTEAFSQNFTFSLLRQPQKAYLEFDNPLSCTVEGLSCSSISLVTDNGVITKISGCEYSYKPSKIEDARVIINKNVNGKFKKIGEFLIAVRNIPDPIAAVGGLSGGLIKKGALNAQGGIRAGPPYYLGFELDYLVKSFLITATRNNEILFSYSSTSNVFTPELHSFLDTPQKKDVVIFSSILVLMVDGKEVRAAPLEFIIE